MPKELSGNWLAGLTGETLNHSDIRADVSLKLGKELTAVERKCYGILMLFGIQPATTQDIYQQLYGSTDWPENMGSNISQLVNHIRAKLGETAIISRPGFGYITRRGLIEHMVKNNLESDADFC
jgi:hypothetical protein